MTQEEFIGWDAVTRRGVFAEVAAQKGVADEVVEKDFWVTFVLGRLFGDTTLRELLRFKGGTSLSKGYSLIDRFSEDIDLVVEWSRIPGDLGGLDVQETIKEGKSPKELQKELAVSVPKYLKDSLVPEIDRCLDGVLTARFDNQDALGDAGVVWIDYPATCENDSYLSPHIKLELGVLGAHCPNEDKGIKSLVSEYVNEIESPGAQVVMVTALETFWEKISILHQEHHRQPDHPYKEGATNRISRHYYDVYQILGKYGFEEVLRQAKLLEQAKWYTETFHRRKWASLSTARKGSLALSPSDYALANLKDDYAAMKDLIWGEYPAFDQILSRIEEFENAYNRDDMC